MSDKIQNGKRYSVWAGNPSVQLLVKLGKIAVLADRISDRYGFDPDGGSDDIDAVDALLADPEVRDWLEAMGPLVEVKR